MKRAWYRQGETLLQDIDRTIPGEEELVYWYIGQCGFIYKKHVVVYIDPMFSDLTGEDGSTRRYYQAPFAPEEVRADYILCTHGHLDHLDVPALAKIAQADSHTTFIVPGACVRDLTEAGIAMERIVEARAGEKITLPHLTVVPVSAAHPVHQKTAQGGDVALCYQLKMDQFLLLHLGDTYLTDQLLADLTALETPDLFFAPVNGGDYFRTARDCIGNLNMNETAQLAVLLKADVTVPTHYDMVMGNTVDPLEFVQTLRELDTAARWQLPALGESVVYRKYEDN